MEMPEVNQPPRNKTGYGLRLIAVILLGLLGVYSCNSALYNGWLTAVSNNASRLEQLSLRFGLFAAFACLAFVCALILLVTIIRSMNREYRRAERLCASVESAPRATDTLS